MIKERTLCMNFFRALGLFEVRLAPHILEDIFRKI
jgi:hypothetical protein